MEKCPKCNVEMQFITRTTVKDQKKLHRCSICGLEIIVSCKKWENITLS